jgi:hypothetical protein
MLTGRSNHYIFIERKKMNYSSVIAEELKGLNNDQLKSIYRFIKSFKREKQTLKQEISLEEIWQITSRSKGNWSKAVEEMREERL